jgi:hypothetical protein
MDLLMRTVEQEELRDEPSTFNRGARPPRKSTSRTAETTFTDSVSSVVETGVGTDGFETERVTCGRGRREGHRADGGGLPFVARCRSGASRSPHRRYQAARPLDDIRLADGADPP